MTNPDEPDSPCTTYYTCRLDGSASADDAFPGLTKLEAFTIAALQGLCANPGGPFQTNASCGWSLTNCTAEQVGQTAVEIALGAIEALNKGAE